MMQQRHWVSTLSFKLFLIFFMLTSILLAVPAYQYYALKTFLENSDLTWGEIVAITQKENGKDSTVHFLTEMSDAEYRSLMNYYSFGKYFLYPTIEFVDQHGNTYRFVSKQDFPSGLLGFRKMQVYYDPINPQKAIINTPRNYRPISAWLVLASFPGTITLVMLLGVMGRKWFYRS